MKTKELIEALSNLNPDTEVFVDIMQSNKSYGVFQVGISMVDATYSGATIRVWIREGSFISQRKNNLLTP